MDTKLIVRYGIRETMGIVIMGAVLFCSAGRVDWWPAWVALAVMAAWISVTAVVIFRTNPALLILRTVLEDRTLLVELPGYVEYARQVRYRLIPGIW